MDDIVSLHREEYGVKPEVIAEAPGIVNIMGEHTDYNEGFVLQAALDKKIRVAVSKRKDNSLRFYDSVLEERKRTTITNLKYKREDRWANYCKGILEGLLKRNCAIRGMDFTIQGDIPQRIGLGSSSALTTASALALRKLYNFRIKDMEIISLALEAERKFLKVDTEISDHFTSFVATKNTFLFLDLRDMSYEQVAFKSREAVIVITVSNVPEVSITSELKQRKKECRECVDILSKNSKPGTALRDYSSEELSNSMGAIPENIRRICTHVVEENHRVLETLMTLRDEDIPGLGKLLNRSHESLRDNYEVSCPELDWLVKRACELDGVYGARMTGSGFGGCTITLIRKDSLELYKEKLLEYERIFGFTPELLECNPSQGARIVYF